MNKPDSYDLQALTSAKQYMGAVAWPTVVFALAVFLSYGVTLVLALLGNLSLWVATPLLAVLTYLSYTVLHESAHGSISGSKQSLRWLNETLGYVAGWILMIPLTAHRHEHLAHHRNTNDEHEDPDYHVGDICNSPVSALLAAAQIFKGQFSYYLQHRWDKAPTRQNLNFCLEVAVVVLPRIAILAAGYWFEGLLLLGVAWLVGLSITLYLFAYLVHRPHENVGRYVDTSTVLAPGRLQPLLNWLWVFQNYHSIHHLFPRVPFYQYQKLFRAIEDVMIAKGAPIYRLSVSGLTSTSAYPCHVSG
ncbi:MAG: fatty acid desaturase [Halioglobus sp.]